MALRKPLVLVDGQLQQLQSGDTLDAPIATPSVMTATNSETVAITIGQPVYVSGDGTVGLAKADAAATTYAIGLVADDSIAASAAGTIQIDDVISSADWTAVTGSATLTAGAIYYLSADTAGTLTTTAPTTGYVVEIGEAISSTELKIQITRPILL